MYDSNYPNSNANYENTNQSNPDQRDGSYTQGASGSPYGHTGQNTYANRGPENPYANRNSGNPYTDQTAGGMYSGHTTNYQYGNTYPNDYTLMNGNQKNKKEKKKKKEHSAYFKKALVSVSLGILFGIFAGVGIYAVQSVTDLFGGHGEAQVSDAQPSPGEEALLEEAGQVVEDAEDATGKTVTDLSGQDQTAQAANGIQNTGNVTTIVSDVSAVVEEVMPAMVSINNHYTERMSFFGQSYVNEADASGSGIIVGKNDTELLIVTNYHVIADAEKLTVKFVEGSEIEAAVKGTDADMDLAVISVSLSDIDNSTMDRIAIATLGDSDSLELGEPAIAIGNSLGYGQSVTTGVISALDRSIELSDGSNGTFIQTDAAINPGNSGGALLNMKGEVIGINSNKIGGSAIEGMGYAIPISSASPIIADLMLKETKNKVAEDKRGYLGISGIDVPEDVSEMYGIPEGVFVYQVYDNTAAKEAGLQKGDIITEFNGESIESMDDLEEELQFHAKGESVELTVMSASNNGYVSRKVTLTLGNKA